jgi:tetratricopeptide (TPR) repeat protein
MTTRKPEQRPVSLLARIIAFTIVPLTLLLLLEGGLRLAGLHTEYPLLKTRDESGEMVWELNKNVAGRWFFGKRGNHPELNNTITYKVEKDDSLRRILCLGGSTTAGFPYDNLPTFPTMLRLKLNDYYDNLHFETVNLGISAINSHSVLDIVEETLDLQPDAVVVYMGHNEFYGVFGGASTQSAGASWLVGLMLGLDDFAIVQNLQTLLAGNDERRSRQDRTLMAQMVEEQFIPLDSELYRHTRDAFRDNYTELVDFYIKHGIPVFISTLVSNEADLEPFSSRWKNRDNSTIETMWIAAKAAETLGEFGQADSLYTSLFYLDSSHARVVYKQAQLQLRRGHSARAKELFIRAREMDGMRFRAPLEWNAIIRELSKNNGVALIPMDSIFSHFSIDGIIGRELILEHLHPNWYGYNLMADVITRTLSESNTFGQPKREPKWTQLENYLWYNSTDMEAGNLVNAILTHGFPFNQESFSYDEYKPLVAKPVAKLVYDYLMQGGYWNRLHYDVAQFYIQQGRPDLAKREYAAVSAYLPQLAFAREKMGFLYLNDGDFRNAFAIFRDLVREFPDEPSHKCRLGQAMAMGADFKGAIYFLEQGIAGDVRRGRKLSDDNFYNFKFWLGYAYANNNQLYFAERQITQVLEFNPNNASARDLLIKIKAARKQSKNK